MKPLLAVLTTIVTIGGIGYSVVFTATNLPRISEPPKCVEQKTEYFWEHWDGSRRYVGSDIETALRLANGKPVSESTHCIKWD